MIFDQSFKGKLFVNKDKAVFYSSEEDRWFEFPYKTCLFLGGMDQILKYRKDEFVDLKTLREEDEWDDVEPRICLDCSAESRYRPFWDSHYCPKCNKWLSWRCTEERCDFNCCERPEKPLKNIP